MDQAAGPRSNAKPDFSKLIVRLAVPINELRKGVYKNVVVEGYMHICVVRATVWTALSIH